MRRAKVMYQDAFAGLLLETDEGLYTFQYNQQYIISHPGQFITFNIPVNDTLYINKRLFPFFEGLIPEGWLLDIGLENWKLNENDRMGLLLAFCSNCIGAVSIVPVNEDHE